MGTLSNPQNTIAVLKKYNFNFQKKYGQNFLIDSHVLDRIIDAAEITKEDCVLEIGPGIGTMTQCLAENAGEVVAVEIDRALIPILTDTLSEYDNVTVINEDILKVDINRIVLEKNNGQPVKVVANLPYYITTPIIMGLFESHVPLKSITIMVQKEVADRMRVGPGTKDYGALSLAVQYYAQPEIVANVPPNCFMPRPNVGSAVIRLSCHEAPPVSVEDEHFMFRLIRASFNQRRKTLVNGLGNAAGLAVTKEQAAAALEQMNLSATIRGEALTLEQFAELSNLLQKRGVAEKSLQARGKALETEDVTEAVIFDMDGVLFDTERISVEGWLAVGREMGIEHMEIAAYGCIGLNMTDCRIFLNEHYGDAFPYEELKRRTSEIFQKRLREEGLPVMPGVEELLAYLKSVNIKIGLASSTRTEVVRSHLERAGLTEYFMAVVGGDMVEHSKPQPDIYQMACRMLSAAPEHSIAIEDSPNGIRAAHAAGMKPIMVPDMVQPDEALATLLYRKYDSLTAVKEFLEGRLPG